MNVKDIMSSNVVKISPGTFLEEAARLMKTYGVGMLPVIEGDRVLGVVTDRDIAVRALAQGWNALLTEARVIMSENIVWCFEDTPAAEAARLMAKRQIHRLLVFSREMILAGVVSLDDIAVALRDEKAVGQTLRDVSCPVVAYRAAA